MSGDARKPRVVLLVEDDAATAELERRALSRAGVQVRLVTRVGDALACIEREPLSAILLDYQLPDGEPWSVVKAATEHVPKIPVILATGMGSERVAAEAMHHGVADYVKKTDSFWEELPLVVDRVLRLSDAENALEAERLRLVEAQRLAHIGNWEWDVQHDSLSWSDELCRIFGLDKATFRGSYEAFLECVHPDDRELVANNVKRAFETHEPFRHLHRTLVNGALRWVEGRGTVVVDRTGTVVRMLGTGQDVTEREQQQARLREADRFFELSLDMLSTANVDGYFRRISPAFSVLGWSEQEFLSTPFLDLVHPDDVPATLAEVEKLAQGVKSLHFENRYRCKDGSYRWISWVSTPDRDGMLYGAGRDITEQKRAAEERDALNRQLQGLNLELKNSLREREVLLQEIHHRVKNNLQVISSLINMQIRKLEAGENRDALEECRARVQTISLIHEKLYQSSDYARVPFSDYVKSLAATVFDANRQVSGNVRLELSIEHLALPVDQAIPCGLIVNELITNALKHGFPNGRTGSVTVRLARLPGARVRLTVENDGVALPVGFDASDSRSLGLPLVATLAKQLDAQLGIVHHPHAAFQLTFGVTSTGPDDNTEGS